jgi:hypothetical protein
MNYRKLSNEIKVTYGIVCRWFKVGRVPKRYWNILAQKFNVEEEYINKVINDMDLSQPRKKGFNTYKIIDDIVEIYLENKKGLKKTAIIDLVDLQQLIDLDYHWFLQWDIHKKAYYVAATTYPNGYGYNKGKTLRLNALLCDTERKIVADHADGDTMNNRRYNLRVVDLFKNAQNRIGANCNNKTGVRNVHLCKTYDDNYIYKVQIMKDYKPYCWEFGLDQFEEACDFAKQKRLELFGEYSGD